MKDGGSDWIFAAILGLLAILAFAAQALTVDEKTAPLAVALFNVLQFTLTTGFAWFSSRAASRAEFAESMKRFATSAYRRVADIEVIVEKLQRRIGGMRSQRHAEDCADLDVIAAVVDDAAQVVRSSISDWADVIGEELLALEQIKVLEREKRAVDQKRGEPGETAEISRRITDLDKQIAALVDMLPINLQLEAKREDRTEILNDHATQWLSRMHSKEKGLNLRVIAGGEYTCTRDPDTLTTGETLHTALVEDGGIDVLDGQGHSVGRVLNNSPLDYHDFRDALFSCYGAERIAVTFQAIHDEETEEGVRYVWYSVRVVSEPLRRHHNEDRPTES